MPATVAYVRVSSKAQDFPTQKHAIEKEAGRRGDTIAEWREEKRSGKTLARPVLDQLREDVRVGAVRKLYVFKLDRLTRSGVADTFKVVDELRKAGCVLVAVADNLTIQPGTDDIVSETLVFALGLAAKLQRAAINDNIAAARERMAAEGKPWGRPSSLSPKERQRIAQLRAEGLSHREIAQKMHVKRSTVTLSLKKAREAA